MATGPILGSGARFVASHVHRACRRSRSGFVSSLTVRAAAIRCRLRDRWSTRLAIRAAQGLVDFSPGRPHGLDTIRGRETAVFLRSEAVGADRSIDEHDVCMRLGTTIESTCFMHSNIRNNIA